MKILVTGASGLLGRRLCEKLSKTEEVTGTYCGYNGESDNFTHLDIRDWREGDRLFSEVRPDAVVHAAALTNVDFCEKNVETARSVNANGTRNIVDLCEKYGAKMVYISSDFVFDGQSGPYTEQSQISPVNFYGQTKAQGESYTKDLEHHLIVRPAILYGKENPGRKPGFIPKLVSQLRDGMEVVLDDTIIKYPTLIDDVSEAVHLLLKNQANGIFHIASPEGMTKYQWGLKVAQAYLLNSKLIKSGELPGEAPRPKDVMLDSSKIKQYGFEFLTENIERGIEAVKNQKSCIFNMIYSVRPDVLVPGQTASAFRINLGRRLAKEHPVGADMVVPIPETGMYGAVGFAEESKIPFHLGIVRGESTKRTLLEPSLTKRIQKLEEKLKPVPDVVAGKRVVLIDEALIAGTTLGVCAKKLRAAGVKELHARIFSAPMMNNCPNGVLMKGTELLAKKYGKSKEEIEKGLAKHFELNSLHFLSLDEMLSQLPSTAEPCHECFREKPRMKIIRLNEVPDEVREGGNYSIKRTITEALKKNPSNVGFYQTTIPAGSHVGEHAHTNLDEFLEFKTPGKVRVGSETYELSPGDIMYLPPNTPHYIFAEGKDVILTAIKLPDIPNDKINL